nr:hypothetical protein [Tanacetum cinerariifolium]
QDRTTIAKSSILPHDSAPRVTSLAAVEGTQDVEINRLKERVKQLEEREGVAATNSGDDAPIKGRSMDEGKAATKRVSDDTEEMATVTPAEGSVLTGSEEVPTASPVFATATVVTPVTRRKGKEVMVESETPKKKKVQEQINTQVARELEEQLEKEDQRRAEQIARDAEIARIHAEEELQSMIDGLDSNNETVAKYLEEYRWKVKDFRGMTFEEVEAKFNSVCKQMKDFIPMGSKEEAEKIKRKGINLEQESAKKQSHQRRSLRKQSLLKKFLKRREDLNQLWRLVKETLSTRQPTSDKEMELWVELSRLYEPNEEDQLQRQRNLYACGEGLPSEEGSSTYDDLLQTFTGASSVGRIVRNKMHKAFPLSVIKFPLVEEVPTASIKGCHCQKKCEATARKIALL